MNSLFGKCLLLLVLALGSCKLYKRDVLFRADKEKEKEFYEISKQVKTPPNYLIAKNDYIEFQIFTNKGEIIIDPTSEFAKQVANAGSSGINSRLKFLIQADGCADLPIIGHVKLDSLTLHQSDSLLSVLYGKYYLDVFVVSKISNRRVFILGLGQGGSVGGGSGGGSARSTNFDIEHENTTLFEVLSKAGGVGQFSFADRIKVIRGNPSNPTIFTINLTRWNSFQESNMVIQPNDVIYIEPARRKGFELVRDVAQVSVVFTTLITTLLIIRIF